MKECVNSKKLTPTEKIGKSYKQRVYGKINLSNFFCLLLGGGGNWVYLLS